MENQFSRTEILLGTDAVNFLKMCKVAVFGLGGVGGACAEALARVGIGQFLLIDDDTVSESNINRQIIALHSTIGRKKTEVMKERILDINPSAIVETLNLFVLSENLMQINLCDSHCVIDAIDTMSTKIALAERCFNEKIHIISCMGAGNRLIPSFEAADLYATKNCPVAKVMRRELKKLGVSSLKTVYSAEEPLTVAVESQIADPHSNAPPRKNVIGSVSFVPNAAGLMLAAEAIKVILLEFPQKTRNY